MNKINIIGAKFGMLTVIREDIEFNNKEKAKGNKHNTYRKFICLCECGNEKSIGRAHLVNGQIKSCGCLQERVRENHPLFEGHEEILAGWFNSRVLHRNKYCKSRKPLEINIDIKYAWDLFIKQDRKCALSGIPLLFPRFNADRSGTASMDRIDSSKGYIHGNVQWVHKDINKMKNVFSQDYFIEMCRKVVETNDSCLI